MKHLIFSIFLTIFIIISSKSFAQTNLSVGFAGSEPFVLQNSSEITGLSVDLWKEVAIDNKIVYTSKYFDTVDQALDALQKKK